jgi:hypothetical protein
MKKIIAAFSILSFTFLFIGCSSNTEADPLLEKVQGKWQLTGYYDDIGDTEDAIVEDGYVLNLKNDGTFTSDELPGFTGGVL